MRNGAVSALWTIVLSLISCGGADETSGGAAGAHAEAGTAGSNAGQGGSASSEGGSVGGSGGSASGDGGSASGSKGLAGSGGATAGVGGCGEASCSSGGTSGSSGSSNGGVGGRTLSDNCLKCIQFSNGVVVNACATDAECTDCMRGVDCSNSSDDVKKRWGDACAAMRSACNIACLTDDPKPVCPPLPEQ